MNRVYFTFSAKTSTAQGNDALLRMVAWPEVKAVSRPSRSSAGRGDLSIGYVQLKDGGDFERIMERLGQMRQDQIAVLPYDRHRIQPAH